MLEEGSDFSVIFCSKQLNAFDQNNTKIEIGSRYDRKLLPSDLEELIECDWIKACANNKYLFNGSKFRFAGYKLNEDETSINLLVGLTDYKDFIGTNQSENCQRYQDLGWQNHADTKAHLAHPLGVGALLQTADERFVFLLRTNNVGESKGLICIPGGHPEPKHISDSSEHASFEPSKVVEEIFSSVKQEIVDELNVPRDSLSEPYLIGIVGNKHTGEKATIEFLVRSTLTSSEIELLYRKGEHEEAFETSDIYFYSIDNLNNIKTAEFQQRFTASAQGALKIYRHLIDK